MWVHKQHPGMGVAKMIAMEWVLLGIGIWYRYLRLDKVSRLYQDFLPSSALNQFHVN